MKVLSQFAASVLVIIVCQFMASRCCGQTTYQQAAAAIDAATSTGNTAYSEQLDVLVLWTGVGNLRDDLTAEIDEYTGPQENKDAAIAHRSAGDSFEDAGSDHMSTGLTLHSTADSNLEQANNAIGFGMEAEQNLDWELADWYYTQAVVLANNANSNYQNARTKYASADGSFDSAIAEYQDGLAAL